MKEEYVGKLLNLIFMSAAMSSMNTGALVMSAFIKRKDVIRLHWEGIPLGLEGRFDFLQNNIPVKVTDLIFFKALSQSLSSPNLNRSSFLSHLNNDSSCIALLL